MVLNDSVGLSTVVFLFWSSEQFQSKSPDLPTKDTAWQS